jgi:hypothetical protein
MVLPVLLVQADALLQLLLPQHGQALSLRQPNHHLHTVNGWYDLNTCIYRLEKPYRDEDIVAGLGKAGGRRSARGGGSRPREGFGGLAGGRRSMSGGGSMPREG